MANSILFGLFILSLTVVPHTLAVNGVTFLYPVDNLVLNYQDTVNVSWTSRFPEPLLYTFCSNTTNGPLDTESVQHVSTDGSELVLLDFPGATHCHFDIRPNTSAGYGMNSPDFVVLTTARARPVTVSYDPATASASASATGSDQTPSTSASPTASTSSILPGSDATGSPTTVSTNSPATVSTGLPANSSNTSAPSSSSDDGAKIGIGVGVGVGACVAVAGVAALFVLRRRRRSPKAISHSYQLSPSSERFNANFGQKLGSEGQYTYMQDMQNTNGNANENTNVHGSENRVNVKPVELSADARHELDGSQAAFEMSPETAVASIKPKRSSWDQS